MLNMVAATSTIGAQKSHDCCRVIRLAACSKQTAWGFSLIQPLSGGGGGGGGVHNLWCVGEDKG